MQVTKKLFRKFNQVENNESNNDQPLATGNALGDLQEPQRQRSVREKACVQAVERSDLTGENRTLVSGRRSGSQRAMVSFEKTRQRVPALSPKPLRCPPQEVHIFQPEIS